MSFFDSLDILNDFTGQVVISRREAGVRKWEDWGSGPYAWLLPDFVPPSRFLIVQDPLTEASRIWVEPHLIDAEFCKAWIPFFCRSRHPVITVDQFWGFGGHLLTQEPQFDLPGITERDLQEVAGAKLQVGWMVGLGMRLRPFHSLGSPVWLFCWSWLSPLVFGLSVYWMLILP